MAALEEKSQSTDAPAPEESEVSSFMMVLVG